MTAFVGLDRVALSGVTVPDADLARQVELVRDVGASGVGPWGSDLAPVGIERARRMIDRAGLRVANAVPLANSVLPYGLAPVPREPSARERAIASQLPGLATLEPESVVVLTGPVPRGADPGWARDTVVAALGRLASQAADLGVRLAVEPIRATCAADFSLVTSFAEAVALVEEVDGPLAILVDTWHVHGEDGLAELLATHIDLVGGVQVADHRADASGWTDRACPGEGVGTSEVLGALLDAGWTGMVDVEVFSDDGRLGQPVHDPLWARPDEEIVRRATAAFRRDGPSGPARR